MISYIVSSWNRPLPLLTCVSSLLQQKGDKEIIICDNSDDSKVRDTIQGFASMDKCIIYIYTGDRCKPDINAGYKAQNLGAERAAGDWLCFPSDDCYYVPGFQRVMLETDADNRGCKPADLIYCDMLYDPRYNAIASQGIYAVVPAYPRLRFMDKSNFIVRDKHFKGFDITHPNGYGDWLFIDSCLKKGVRFAKAPGILCVHN